MCFPTVVLLSKQPTTSKNSSLCGTSCKGRAHGPGRTCCAAHELRGALGPWIKAASLWCQPSLVALEQGRRHE